MPTSWYTDGMSPKLTPEILEALRQQPERPLRVYDEQGDKVYLVVAEESLPTLWEDYLRAEISNIERGEVADWNVDATIAEAEQRRA